MARHIEFRSLAHDPPRARRRSSSSPITRTLDLVYQQPVGTAVVLTVLGVGLWTLLHAREAQAASSPRP